MTQPWQSPYMAMNGNPILFADPSGAFGDESTEFTNPEDWWKGDDGSIWHKYNDDVWRKVEGITVYTKYGIIRGLGVFNRTLLPHGLVPPPQGGPIDWSEVKPRESVAIASPQFGTSDPDVTYSNSLYRWALEWRESRKVLPLLDKTGDPFVNGFLAIGDSWSALVNNIKVWQNGRTLEGVPLNKREQHEARRDVYIEIMLFWMGTKITPTGGG